MMNHILDLSKQKDDLFALFQRLQSGNVILFLGAGASVGEKHYLSKDIISYYESYLNTSLGESNITKWIDILSANSKFDRRHFDNEVVKMLQKLRVTEAHKILASIPWKEIITTNYDLLVERAYDEVSDTSGKVFDLKPIKNLRQYNYRESRTEIKYIKLNGCIQDPGLYPLAFSSVDFDKLKAFYKYVLNDLKNLSDNIGLLSIGYSYSDEFGKNFLEKFDSYNFRDRKWIFNVDPYPNEYAFEYYKQKRICIVKCSFLEFFTLYREWEKESADVLIKRKGLHLNNSRGVQITGPFKLLLNLDGVVRQIGATTKDRFVNEVEFYKGEEPTYSLIAKNADVIRNKALRQFELQLFTSLEDKSSKFIPIFFIKGDFGIGKSTFALRAIFELEKKEDLDIVAFEILDLNKVRREVFIELIAVCKAKNILFYCEEIEVESYFKALLDLQRELSIEQIQDSNIFFVVPIRENILERYKLNRTIPRSVEIKFDGGFEPDEINELLEKLKSAGLINFRDAQEKRILVNRIQKDFSSDSFISLLGIITNGRHENDLISSFNQLSSDAQKAFLYTALLHKHKLLMPASLLKQNISMDWEQFTSRIIRAEGKGILFQELKITHGTQPDLYFRTKHPLIASKLVDRFIPNKDKQFSFYEGILRNIQVGQTNSFLANDLLKSFSRTEEFNDFQINKLFDVAFRSLSDDPYFLLNYSINLQRRKTEEALKKALELLIYAESLLERKNHKFIHRRAVINFDLAKIYFEKEEALNHTMLFLSEARQLFMIKQLFDLSSAYSYADYIRMLIWELENIEHAREDDLQTQVLIEELFDSAKRLVTDNIEWINQLQNEYANYLKDISDNADYKLYLDGLYEDVTLRPYACILLYNYYNENHEAAECSAFIQEMENYLDNTEVLKFLFKYYGRNLHDVNNRIKLLRISRQNETLEKENSLRFNYFNFVAESYNFHFYEGRMHLQNIQAQFLNLSPEYHMVWLEPSGNPEIFNAVIVKKAEERYKAVKITDRQLTVRLVKGNYDNFTIGMGVRVKLHFYLYGLMAEIIKDSPAENSDF